MKRQFVVNLVMAAFVLIVAVALVWAKRQGMADASTVTRGTMVAVGIMLAVNANLIPKAGTAKTERQIALQRVSGWAMALGGIGYAAAWAFVPLSHAVWLSMAAVAAAIVWVIGFCVLSSRPKTA
ncbi:MAG TPA: hypothetical protein VG407_13930 [Caulobacteraceae bacterium]|jgi:hypothetical protein|nr:hypothetical protein [Caulobacteraceae bacterium]